MTLSKKCKKLPKRIIGKGPSFNKGSKGRMRKSPGRLPITRASRSNIRGKM